MFTYGQYRNIPQRRVKYRLKNTLNKRAEEYCCENEAGGSLLKRYLPRVCNICHFIFYARTTQTTFFVQFSSIGCYFQNIYFVENNIYI
jgi:hypothetical protein